MLALVALASIAPIQTGCYGISTLCKRLTEVTGTRHVATQNLWDYPVFVSVKSSDPARIRSLVASALRSEWVNDGGKLRLRSKKPSGPEDFLEFKRLFQAAAANDKVSLGLPLQDLYELPPGRILRFGLAPTPYIKQLATPILTKQGPPADFVLIRRVAPGAFEYDMGGHEVNFKGIPPTMRDFIGADLQKKPVSAAQKASIMKLMTDPAAVNSKWKLGTDEDPIASLLNLMLKPVGDAVTKDLVIALPDFSIFCLLPSEGGDSVQSVLEAFSLCIRWDIVDGAAVGELTNCEINHPAQTSRKALSEFISEVGRNGVANISNLSQYIAEQRPCASESWTDAMLLVMTGTTVDQEFIGDYPFNVRMYTDLTPADWQLVKAKKPFVVSALSGAAQEALLTVMLQSRTRIQREDSIDPALWQTLDPQRLTVNTEFVEEPGLIGFTTAPGEVNSVQQTAADYSMRKKSLGREPLYQPCLRRLLSINVLGASPQEHIKTGFSETVPDVSKPVVWSQLPAKIAKQFREAAGNPQIGAPAHAAPPPVAQGVPPPR